MNIFVLLLFAFSIISLCSSTVDVPVLLPEADPRDIYDGSWAVAGEWGLGSPFVICHDFVVDEKRLLELAVNLGPVHIGPAARSDACIKVSQKLSVFQMGCRLPPHCGNPHMIKAKSTWWGEETFVCLGDMSDTRERIVINRLKAYSYYTSERHFSSMLGLVKHQVTIPVELTYSSSDEGFVFYSSHCVDRAYELGYSSSDLYANSLCIDFEIIPDSCTLFKTDSFLRGLQTLGVPIIVQLSNREVNDNFCRRFDEGSLDPMRAWKSSVMALPPARNRIYRNVPDGYVKAEFPRITNPKYSRYITDGLLFHSDTPFDTSSTYREVDRHEGRFMRLKLKPYPIERKCYAVHGLVSSYSDSVVDTYVQPLLTWLYSVFSVKALVHLCSEAMLELWEVLNSMFPLELLLFLSILNLFFLYDCHFYTISVMVLFDYCLFRFNIYLFIIYYVLRTYRMVPTV